MNYAQKLAEYKVIAMQSDQHRHRDQVSINSVCCIVAVHKLRDELEALHGKKLPTDALIAMRDFMSANNPLVYS
jgi:hypothetical protein